MEMCHQDPSSRKDLLLNHGEEWSAVSISSKAVLSMVMLFSQAAYVRGESEKKGQPHHPAVGYLWWTLFPPGLPTGSASTLSGWHHCLSSPFAQYTSCLFFLQVPTSNQCPALQTIPPLLPQIPTQDRLPGDSFLSTSLG